MRILWVTRGSTDAASDQGDAIYDRKICAPLRQSHSIETVGAPRGGRLAQLARAAAHVSAPEAFGFDLPETVTRIRAAATAFAPDAIVFSHEHLDRLAAAVRHALLRQAMGKSAPAFVTLRHNVTSDMMASFFADVPPAASLYRALAQRQERAALASPLFDGVIALSTRDRALITRLFGRNDVALAMPGAPPSVPLAPDATVARDLLVLGTYDWFPKARDLKRFATALAQSPLPGVTVYGDTGLPPEIAASLSAAPAAALDRQGAIRFGVITDRFTAGHKLKTSAYLMQNCAVLSFADVIDDFASIPNAARWIHRVRSRDEIAPVMEAMAARPPGEVRAELVALKTEISERMAWRVGAEAVGDAIMRAIKSRKAAAG